MIYNSVQNKINIPLLDNIIIFKRNVSTVRFDPSVTDSFIIRFVRIILCESSNSIFITKSMSIYT